MGIFGRFGAGFGAAFMLAALCACSDSGTSAVSGATGSSQSNAGAASGCSSDNSGAVIFVAERGAAYYCDGQSGTWLPLPGAYSEPGTSSSLGGISSSSADVSGTLTDSRDGQTYRTVKIGYQTWMAENLNYNYDAGTARSFCYGGEADSCAKYGRLYTWSAAMDSAGAFSEGGRGCGYGRSCEPTYPVRGACPEGWHLPNKIEFYVLRTAVGGEDVAGKALKSASGWRGGGNGTDAYGFGALPAGSRNNNGDFYNAGYGAYFWSATEYDSYYAYYLLMLYNFVSARA